MSQSGDNVKRKGETPMDVAAAAPLSVLSFVLEREGWVLAVQWILLTDVAGILEDRDDPGSLVKQIDIKGVKRMVEEGKIAGGMIPKVNCCIRSLAQGVKTTSIIDRHQKST
ncbi:Aspartate/glutamate/uridylate kinase [Macleaya cordata]|uniref:Aspartate/glutamate/uridylate kinase n=1 Tax=Macleaya cordata TaxID=56857 RepID=A0A200QHW6_MACCD|nr:Aspartate/glutamate/uridylate kinase [Macleaya cordata]